MKIEPRKKKDWGGIIMMPLVKNVPVPKSDAWKKKVCPACGRACWKIPLTEGFKEEMFAGRLCTECAIRAGVRKEEYTVAKKLDEIMECVCDELCKYPEKAESQEELDMICAECPIGEYRYWMIKQIGQDKEKMIKE